MKKKLKKLFKKPKMKKKRKYYYDDYYNSDEAVVKSDNSDEDGNDNESENEEINSRKKNFKIKKNLKQTPPKKKKEKSYNMLKYRPGLSKAACQGQLEKTETKRKHADDSYKSKKVIEFNIKLAGNQYTNFHNIHLCFPIKIKSAADNDTDITAGYIPVNNFFAHWIKEIDIKRYGDDIPILPLSSTENMQMILIKVKK